MIGTDEFAPLSYFYNHAKTAINYALQDRIGWEARRNMKEDERAEIDRDLIDKNIEAAAQFLIFDLFTRYGPSEGEQRFYLLTRDLQKITVPFSILRPKYSAVFAAREVYEARKKEVKSGKIGKRELLFGVQSLALNYWRRAICKETLFKNRPISGIRKIQYSPMYYVPMLDWATGTLNLDVLSAVAKATDHIRSALTCLEDHQIETSRTLRHLSAERRGSIEHEDVSQLLKIFSPFDGCSIVAPAEWAQFITSAVVSDAATPDFPTQSASDLPPKQAILELIDAHPEMTKSEIRQELFPNLSVRQFERHWANAASVKPELSAPGRKKKPPKS